VKVDGVNINFIQNCTICGRYISYESVTFIKVGSFLFLMSILSVDDLKIGGEYLHVSGLRYRLDGFVFDVTGYEKTNELKKKIIYTQLEDGERCLTGTQFVRDVEDFLKYFSSC
jgi:hypothetical protein